MAVAPKQQCRRTNFPLETYRHIANIAKSDVVSVLEGHAVSCQQTLTTASFDAAAVFGAL